MKGVFQRAIAERTIYLIKNSLKKILFNPPIARKIVKVLAGFHQSVYFYLGAFAVASEGGIHPKHRLMNYHQFFVNNLFPGEQVLDVGCGNGSLLKDIAIKTQAIAVGVELSGDNVKSAEKLLSDFPKVKIIHSDIRDYNNDNHFDAIVLSNVLEHLDGRVAFLQHLKTHIKPEKFLIRVPMFEREWLVPFKKELGIEWRLDSTHHIEYTESEFRDEMSAAGLEIEIIMFKWGEIYTVATPLK